MALVAGAEMALVRMRATAASLSDVVDAQRHSLRESAARASDREQGLKLEVVRLEAVQKQKQLEKVRLMKTITEIRAEHDEDILRVEGLETALARLRDEKVGT